MEAYKQEFVGLIVDWWQCVFVLVALCRFCRQNVNFSLNIMWDKSQSVFDIIKSDFGGDAMKTLS